MPVVSDYWVSYWVVHSNYSFKWQIHQMFMNGLMKLWLNRYVQNTESFSNESDGCFEMRCGDAKNCSELILLYLLIELFIELLNSHNGENVEWCCLTNCILNIKTFHFEFWPQYAKFLSVVLISPGEAAWTSPQQRNLILSIDALYILYPPLTLNVIQLE